MLSKTLSALVLLCSLVASSLAESVRDSEEPPPAIVVTARRYATPARDVGTSLTTVDAERIKVRQTSDLAEVIREAPGVWVTKGGGIGQATSLYVRGAASNQTKVVLDGFTLNDPTIGNQFNPYDMTTLGIGRVEILRGSQSTLWGSEAIGGVVQMVSRDWQGPMNVRLFVETGSFSTARVRTEVGGGDERLSGGIFVSFVDTENDFGRQDFNSGEVGGRMDWSPHDDLSFGFTFRHIRSHARDPFDFGSPLPRDHNIDRRRETTLFGASAEWQPTPFVTARAQASYFRVLSRFDNGADTIGDPAELSADSRARVGSAAGSVSVNLLGLAGSEDSEHEVVATLGWDYENAASRSEAVSPYGRTVVKDTINDRAWYFQGDATLFGDLRLVAGVRLTDNDFFGHETTATASALYSHRQTDTDIGVNYATGFRAPTPVEFADPFVGNADLKEESSQSLDVGIRQSLADDAVTIELTWFRLEVDDLIAYDPALFILTNFNKTRTDGIELAATWAIDSHWSVGGAFTQQDPKNRDAAAGAEDQLPNRPKAFGNLWVRWRCASWELFGSLTKSRAFKSIGIVGSNDSERRHPGRKTVIDIAGSWRPDERARVFARIENLLDEDYVENERGPRANGRAIFVGVELSLR